MNAPVSGVPIGFTVAEFDGDPESPVKISGEDLYPTRAAAEDEAESCRALAAKHGWRAAYRVCAVVPLDAGEPGRVPYERLARSCERLGSALDAAFEVMGRAVKVAAEDGPEAGMRLVAGYYFAVADEADEIPGEDGPAETATGGADGAAEASGASVG